MLAPYLVAVVAFSHAIAHQSEPSTEVYTEVCSAFGVPRRGGRTPSASDPRKQPSALQRHPDWRPGNDSTTRRARNLRPSCCCKAGTVGLAMALPKLARRLLSCGVPHPTRGLSGHLRRVAPDFPLDGRRAPSQPTVPSRGFRLTLPRFHCCCWGHCSAQVCQRAGHQPFCPSCLCAYQASATPTRVVSVWIVRCLRSECFQTPRASREALRDQLRTRLCVLWVNF